MAENTETLGENKGHPKRLKKELEEQTIEWRRSRVAALLSLGMNQREIAEKVGWDESTISKDVRAIRELAKEQLSNYVENELPYQHTLAVAGLEDLIKRAREIADATKDEKTRLSAISVINGLVMDKLAILAQPEYIQRAIKARKKYTDQLEQLEQEQEVA